MDTKSIMEVTFNILYLIIIYVLAFKMLKNVHGSDNQISKIKKLFAAAFILLAIGDTGHVGFRVIAYLNGGLYENAFLLGMGKLFTAVTITIFYAVFVQIWKIRFSKRDSVFTYFLFACAAARLIILFLPGNEWASPVAPHNWELIRNLPLTIMGLAIALAMLKDSIKECDSTFKWLSVMIFISYAFYMPVILYAYKYPNIGFLMIPKTVAYLFAAYIVYKGLFTGKE